MVEPSHQTDNSPITKDIEGKMKVANHLGGPGIANQMQRCCRVAPWPG